MAAQGLTDVNGPTARRILAEWDGLDWRDCQRATGSDQAARLIVGKGRVQSLRAGFRPLLAVHENQRRCTVQSWEISKLEQAGQGARREIPAASFFNRHVNRIIRIVSRSLYFSMCPGCGESGQQAGLRISISGFELGETLYGESSHCQGVRVVQPLLL